MRVSIKTDWRCSLLALLALTLAGAAVAEFTIPDVKPKFIGQSLLLDGNLDLGLTTKVEEALSKGIPLEVIVDIRLHQQRRWLWDKNVASWTLRRRIQYHALSGQYLVSTGESGADSSESFITQQDALKQLGVFSDFRLALPGTPAEGDYFIEMRVNLDIEALPAPLRPVAYTSLAWHLNSGWTTWKVAR